MEHTCLKSPQYSSNFVQGFDKPPQKCLQFLLELFKSPQFSVQEKRGNPKKI